MASPNSILQVLRSICKHLCTKILLVVLTIAIVVAVVHAFTFYTDLEKARTDASDNRAWSITQIEVDHTNLLLALSYLRMQQGAAGDGERPNEDIEQRIVELRIAFDVFYSRIHVAAVALGTLEESEDLRSNLRALIQDSEQLAVMIDRFDAYDPVQLLAVEDAVTSMASSVRSLALDALGQIVAETSATRYQEIASTKKFLMTSVLYTLFLGFSLWIALLLQRKLTNQVSLINAQNTNMRLVYDATLVAVVATDRNGNIQSFNSAAEQTFGYTEAEAKGRNIADVMIPHHRLDQHRQSMRRYHDTGKGAFINQGTKQTTSLRRDGTEFPVELSIRSGTDAQGGEIFIAFIRDISEQNAYEENLREARDEAQRHATAKTLFLATMSHEMRTPLHGMLASLDLIDADVVDSQTKDLITTARDCGLRTLQQINDVLDLTQIGEVRELLTPFAPAQVVSGIMNELRNLAKDHGDHLSLNVIGAAADAKWLGHPKTFARVMYNLIGNAVKFTRDGSVAISLNFDSHDKKDTILHVSVEDSGRGISQEDQARLLDQFFSTDTGQMGPKSNSTGLGLPIAQAAVKKMDGTLNVESRLGVGSTFFFDIPLKTLPGLQTLLLQPADPAPIRYTGVRCLVVDDNPVNLYLTAQMLLRLGCEAVSCDGGEKAVASVGEQDFDIVFMDLNMPGGISGLEAAHLIRTQEITKAATTPVVILALTADTTSVTTQKWFDGVLHKPVRMHELGQTLGRFFPENTVDTRPANPKPAAMSQDFSHEFSDLFGLIGHEHGGRLLNGMLGDIDAALSSIRFQHADAADHIHRAIGSAAAVGLLEVSHQFQKAEGLAKSGSWKALFTLLTPLELSADKARECVLLAHRKRE